MRAGLRAHARVCRRLGSDLGRQAPADAEALERAAWQAFRSYLVEHAAELRIAPGELAAPRLTAHGERLIQIHVGHQLGGIPVRDAFVKATINSGNLVLLGQRNWGNATLDTTPRISAGEAEAAVLRYLDGIPVSGFGKAPSLEIVPVSGQPDESLVTPGEGVEYRLVWVVRPQVDAVSLAPEQSICSTQAGW